MHGLALTGFLLCGTIAAYGSNILVVLPTASYSHQIFYRAYTLELQRRGHNLTVITANPINDPTLTNFKEIDVEFSYERMKKLIESVTHHSMTNSAPAEILLFFLSEVITELCHTQLADPNVLGIYERNEKFDLVVFEWGLYSCFYPFGKLADWKTIGISSFEVSSAVHSLMGSWWMPSYIADVFLEYSHHMTFLQRLRSTMFSSFMFVFVQWLQWKQTNIARKYFGPDIESVYNMEAKAALIMDNSHFTMSYPRPFSLNVMPIGGPAFHLNGVNPKPLPEALKKFMDDAPHGVIYFSLGTNVKTYNMPSEEGERLLEAFRGLKQKVVWKWENENLRVDLDNVYRAKWFPQIDVLAHPNVKGFVTQGGLQSVGEAIHFQVPMVVIPFFADQGHNAKKLEREGAAIRLEIDQLKSDAFVDALNEIVHNKTYKENVIRLSELVNDQPIPPLEKAVWWTEYVIRHNGAPHLKSTAVTMPWYQYYLLDVLAFLSAVVFILFYISYRFCKFLKRLASSSKTKTD